MGTMQKPPPAWRLFLALGVFVSFTVAAVSNSLAAPLEKSESVPITKAFSVGGKLKYFFRSHTSYEFGNPYPPYQEPLSRLEFPINTWWGGLEMKLNVSRFFFALEGMTNLTQNAHGKFEDSDWTDDQKPDEKTIYSQSNMRVAPSYMVRFDADMDVSDWLRLPKWLSIRPVAGFRWQKFNLVSHDGAQWDLTCSTPALSLPGEGIRFKQQYWQYFIGLRSGVDLSHVTGIKSLMFLMQADWAYVEGKNEDNHLLRAGQRFTYETTYGQAWHASIGLKKDFGKNFAIGLDADYLTINTTGKHRLVNETFNTDMDFSNGVKAWSDQASISLTLEYRF
jgi:hypothetical protein